jgi:uncharacterized membrane protein
MRGLIVLGFMLIILGIFVLFVPTPFIGGERNVVGGQTVQTAVTTLHVPGWTGIAVIAAGLMLVVIGAVGESARTRLY